MTIITITIGILLGYLIKSNFDYIKSLFKRSSEVDPKISTDYKKVLKVIESCDSWSQHSVVTKYVTKFGSKWGNKSNLHEELQILLSYHFSPENKKLKLGVKKSSLGKLIDWLPEPEPKKNKYYGN